MKKIIFLIWWLLFSLAISYAVDIQWELEYDVCNNPNRYISKDLNANCFFVNDYQNRKFYYLIDKSDLTSSLLKPFVRNYVKLETDIVPDNNVTLKCSNCMAYKITDVQQIKLMSKEEQKLFDYYKSKFLSFKTTKYKPLSFEKKELYAQAFIKKVDKIAQKKKDKIAYYKYIVKKISKAKEKLLKLGKDEKDTWKILLYSDVYDILDLITKELLEKIYNVRKQQVVSYLESDNYTNFDRAVLKIQQKYLVKFVDKLLDYLNDIVSYKEAVAYDIKGNISFESPNLKNEIILKKMLVAYKDNRELIDMDMISSWSQLMELSFTEVADYNTWKKFVKYNKYLIDGNSVVENVGDWILVEDSKDVVDTLNTIKQLRDLLNTKPFIRELPKSITGKSHIVVFDLIEYGKVFEKIDDDSTYDATFEEIIRDLDNWHYIYYTEKDGAYVLHEIKNGKQLWPTVSIGIRGDFVKISSYKHWKFNFLLSDNKLDISYEEPEENSSVTKLNINGSLDWDISILYIDKSPYSTENLEGKINLEKLTLNLVLKKDDETLKIDLSLGDIFKLDFDFSGFNEKMKIYFTYDTKTWKTKYDINLNSPYWAIMSWTWEWVISYCKTDFKGEINYLNYNIKINLKDKKVLDHCEHNYIIDSDFASLKALLESKKLRTVPDIILPTKYITK